MCAFASAWTVTGDDYTQPPNIFLVVIDDLGHGDMAYNSRDMKLSSPNILQLAAEGVILSNFYASTQCTPSRCMLMTGRYDMRSGLQDSVIHGTEPRGLPIAETLLPDVLQNAYGYETALIGKWHLGFHQTQYTPRARGFTKFYGILPGGGDHYTHQTTESFTVRGNSTRVKVLTGYNLWENDAPVVEQPSNAIHSTALYSTRAIDLVATHEFGENPLFLYLAYQAVHGPMQVDSKFVDGSIPNGCDKISADLYPAEILDEAIDYSNRRTLCGMVSMIDAGWGQIRRALVARSQWDNTVVALISDNGGVKRHGSSNAPFQGEKGVYFEGGVHIPALVAGGRVEASLSANNVVAGRTCASLMHITDLFTTFLSLATTYDQANDVQGGRQTVASLSEKHGLSLDGFDQWRVLVAGEKTLRTEVLIKMNSQLWGGGGALRVGNYKLLVENSVGDSILYKAGRAYMEEELLTTSELDTLLDARRREKFEEPVYHLYNVVLNPSEDDSGNCTIQEACTNLWSSAEFNAVRQNLLDRWHAYQRQMSSSNEIWQDDGPLADPALFGDTWTPWRDDSGFPYALYAVTD